MRKTKEVLRLGYELGLGHRQIARSCSIGPATVSDYLKRAAAAGLGWPLPEGWDENQLEEALFGPVPQGPQPQRPLPDFAAIQEQLQRHRHLTLQLAWEEYRQGNPDGYGYSRFCELYQRWRRKLDVVLRQEHKAGSRASRFLRTVSLRAYKCEISLARSGWFTSGSVEFTLAIKPSRALVLSSQIRKNSSYVILGEPDSALSTCSKECWSRSSTSRKTDSKRAMRWWL